MLRHEFLLRMADDADGDFRRDIDDAFPLDPLEWLDTDNDGVGNNADTDDDGDGVEDTSDAFPLDATETLIPTMASVITRIPMMTMMVSPMRRMPSHWMRLSRRYRR